MIQAVTAEVFKEFTARLAAELAANEQVDEEFTSPNPEALPLLPLLLRSFRSWLRRLFGRG